MNSGFYRIIILLLALFAVTVFIGAVQQMNLMNSSGIVVIDNTGRVYRHFLNFYSYNTASNNLIIFISVALSAVFLLYTFYLIPMSERSAAAAVQKTARVPENRRERSSDRESDNENLRRFEDEYEFNVNPLIDKIDEKDEDALSDYDALNRLIFGSGKINIDVVNKFCLDFPESALKFAYLKDINGQALDINTLEMFRQWENRGLSRELVGKEINKILKISPPGPDPDLELLLRELNLYRN